MTLPTLDRFWTVFWTILSMEALVSALYVPKTIIEICADKADRAPTGVSKPCHVGYSVCANGCQVCFDCDDCNPHGWWACSKCGCKRIDEDAVFISFS